MSEPLAHPEVPSRYRVHLLPDPKATERGILYRRGEQRFLLAWGQVKRALAAEVGERGGARAIVFDLAVEVAGAECVVCRVDAAPGEAQVLARAIQLGLGPARCDESLRATVSEGWPSRSHPDLETFQEAALESIRFRPLG